MQPPHGSAENGISRQSLQRLLGLMQDGKEIRQYLSRFGSLDRTRFAVIKVGGAVLRDQLDTLGEALAFLHAVGLTPIVLHGAGPQLDARLDAEGIRLEKIDGLRQTTPAALPIIQAVMVEANLALVEAIREKGAQAAPLPLGVFEAELHDNRALELVGTPRRVKSELIRSVTDAGAIPIISSLGQTAGGQIVNQNADDAVRVLVEAFQPYKIVFLTETGGVLDGEGNKIDAINLATDEEALFAADWLQGGMRVKLAAIADLLHHAPLDTSVSMTVPAALAQELFTHTGAGTLVRLGERVQRITDKQALDRKRIEQLVAHAFGRRVTPNWWDDLVLSDAFVSERYRAAAICTAMGDGHYLDKYVVESAARGEGLGQAVWRQMVRSHPRLIWRSKAINPVNGFYLRQCHGHVRAGKWWVFWTGFDFDALSSGLIDAVLAKPETLGEPIAEADT